MYVYHSIEESFIRNFISQFFYILSLSPRPTLRKAIFAVKKLVIKLYATLALLTTYFVVDKVNFFPPSSSSFFFFLHVTMYNFIATFNLEWRSRSLTSTIRLKIVDRFEKLIPNPPLPKFIKLANRHACNFKVLGRDLAHSFINCFLSNLKVITLMKHKSVRL